MTNQLRPTNDALGGVEAIYRAARMLECCPTSRLMTMTADEVLILCEAAACSDWDVGPNQVTTLQAERWYASNGLERPRYTDDARMRPLCDWRVVSYDAWGSSIGTDDETEKDWTVCDERIDGSHEGPEDPSDEEVSDMLRAAGWAGPARWSLEWQEDGWCEVVRTDDGKPMGRLTKEGC